MPAWTGVAAMPARAIAMDGGQPPDQVIQGQAKVVRELAHFNGPPDRHRRISSAVDPPIQVGAFLAGDLAGAFVAEIGNSSLDTTQLPSRSVDPRVHRLQVGDGWLCSTVARERNLGPDDRRGLRDARARRPALPGRQSGLLNLDGHQRGFVVAGGCNHCHVDVHRVDALQHQ